MVRILLIMLVLSQIIVASERVWNSFGSTDANDGDNYDPTGALLTTDSLVLNATSSIAWSLTGDLIIRGITANGYTGSISTNGYDVTTDSRQYWNTTGALNFTNSKLSILGDAAIFYINSFSSFVGIGCTVDVKGSGDTIYIAKSIASSPIKQYFFAYTGYRTYLFTPNTTVCYHNTHVKGGTPYLLERYWMVDPDTTHPYTIDGTSNWGNSSFHGPYMYHSNPNVHVFYFPRWYMGMHMTFRYAPTIATNDTVYFTDSLYSGSIRFNGVPTVRQSITFVVQSFCNIPLFETYGSDSSYHTLICAPGNNNYLEIGRTTFLVPTRFNLYLNGSQVVTYGWNFGAGSASSYIDAGTSTVVMKTCLTSVPFTKIDSARFNGFPLYNVICTLGVNGGDEYMKFKDSLHCKNNLTLKGDVRFLNQFPMKVDGNFTDSLTDTCKISSLYLGRNGYLSSLSYFSWYPSSILTAIGTAKQFVYTNGNPMTKTVIKRGAKLTVK